MKITTTQVTKHLLTELERLDPVSVICENMGVGRGKITIERFGDSWSHYWGSMGNQYTLEMFFLEASDDYLAGKLCRGREWEPDWEGLTKKIRRQVIATRRSGNIDKSNAREYYDDARFIDNEVSAHTNTELLCDVFGDEWYHHLPEHKQTDEYRYLLKIIPVVKRAIISITENI